MKKKEAKKLVNAIYGDKAFNRKKIKITLGDIREVWYAMEKPCAFKDFADSYIEDEDYEVINSWTCSVVIEDDEYFY